MRAAVGCSDRGHTAASQMQPGQVDWDALFGREGARWFHTGGIFAALSETTPLVAKEAMAAAKRHGTVVSYDLNYRPSLWKSIGGKPRAQEVNRELAQYVDVMLGNEEDFTAALGFQVEGLDENLSALDPANFRRMIEQAVAAYPELPRRRHHAAPRPDRVRQRLGARSSTRTARSTSRARTTASRSGTASAAATRSPRASSTASWPARARSGRSSAARPTGRSR